MIAMPAVCRVSALALGLGFSIGIGGPALARDEAESTPEPDGLPIEASQAEELGDYDIADLQRIKVTSVSRKPEKISGAPAAIFVITQEDIRRSGVASIPEALRMAPGINVARIDAGRYAISARGFNDRFSNKLLVLRDGRAIYTPLFGGVFWEKQDALLEDIERIEVIRGPGGTLWGANAFNGVINLTSRNAADTQGWLVSGGGGNQERAFGAVRYGGVITDSVFYRAFAKALDRDDIGGVDRSSGLRSGLTGFRVDGAMAPAYSWTLQGDIYQVRSGETVRIPNPNRPLFVETSNDTLRFSGGNILGRFSRRYGHDAEAVLQVYFDRSLSGFQLTGEDESENIGDVDFQHRFRLASRHHIVWGLGSRVVHDHSRGSYSLSFDPPSRTTLVLNVFAQDTIRLSPRLSVIFGSKVEKNDYTGFELQPNVRLAWTSDSNHTLWGAVSRAVRTPTRLENDVSVAVATLPGPIVVRGLGDPDVLSESVIAYEAGYRLQPGEMLSLDFAAFINEYDQLVSSEFGIPNTTVVPPELPFTVGSKLDGYTYGGEAAAQIKLAGWWSLQPAFSLLRMRLGASRTSSDRQSERKIEGSSPQHQASLRSRLDFPRHWELDGWLRYVDALQSLSVPSYVTLDVRIGWRPVEQIELSVIGQNVLRPAHPEFAPTIRGTNELSEVKRSIFGKIVWRL